MSSGRQGLTSLIAKDDTHNTVHYSVHSPVCTFTTTKPYRSGLTSIYGAVCLSTNVPNPKVKLLVMPLMLRAVRKIDEEEYIVDG